MTPPIPSEWRLHRVPVRWGARLTALIYRSATGLLGDLAYTYDAANRQRTFGNKTLTYDAAVS